MKRDIDFSTPVELRDAEALLERYGAWAQDRYQKRRCSSAEGRYTPPPRREDEPMIQFMPDFDAMKVQYALQAVPMQFRRVLFSIYIPQKEHPMAARRRYRIKSDIWEMSRVEGIRRFWSVYRLRYLTR